MHCTKLYVALALAALSTTAAQASPGDVAPFGPKVERDGFGRLFDNSDPEATTLIDAQGAVVWTRAGRREPSCGSATQALVVESTSATLVDSDTGAAKWTTPVNGSAYCVSDDVLLVRDFANAPACTTEAHSRATGAVLWSRAGCGEVITPVGTSLAVVDDRFGGEVSFALLDAQTGAVLVDRELPAGSIVLGTTQALVTVVDGVFARVDETTGEALWSVPQAGPGWPIFRGDDVVFQYEAPRMTARDLDTGEVRFVVEGAQNLEFLGEELLAWSSGPEGTHVELRACDGALRWTFDASGGGTVAIEEDALYVGTGTRITRLDRASGAVLWQQTMPGSDVMPSMHLVGVVGRTASTVYVNTAPAVRYAPGTVLALDKATGAVQWTYAPNEPVYGIAETETKLLLGVGVYNTYRTLTVEK